MVESDEHRNRLTSQPVGSKLLSDVPADASFVRRIEKDAKATPVIALLVALAGAARGVTPGFEAGWVQVAIYSVAGLLIWLLCTALIWNVADHFFKYSEGFVELARVVGLSALPLLGLWLNLIPAVGGWLVFSFALHGLAFVVLWVVMRSALSVSYLRALAICTASFAMAIVLLAILGVFLVGSPAAGDFVARHVPITSIPDLPHVLEESWKSS